MGGKISSLIIAFVFIALMVFLTLSARALHHTRIPNVYAQRLTHEDFEITRVTPDGVTHVLTHRYLAIPKALYDGGQGLVFIIAPTMVNGERRNVARRVAVTLGDGINDDFYQVLTGIENNHRVIKQSDRPLVHNGLVFVVN
jgi:hypothetical protein